MPKQRRFKLSDTIALCDEVDWSIDRVLRHTFGNRISDDLMTEILEATSEAVAVSLFYCQTKIRRVK